MSVSNQQADWRLNKEIACNATEDVFAEPAMAVAANDEQCCVDLFGALQNCCCDAFVNGFYGSQFCMNFMTRQIFQ